MEKNKPKSRPGYDTPHIKTIEEFFESIGKPIQNVTEEMAGKTQIFLMRRPPKQEKDTSPDGEGE